MKNLLALSVSILLSGCAGGRVYDKNIRHVCLCAVKTVRAHGYVVREQDFKPSEGILVASFSVPDLKGTEMSGSILKRAGAFVWNAWEHTKLDAGRGKGKRVRVEERVAAKFRATAGGLLGWLDWNAENRTTVDLTADVTDYGTDDWVINREERPKDYRESLLTALSDCLAGRQVVAAAPPVRLEPEVMVVETAKPASGKKVSVPVPVNVAANGRTVVARPPESVPAGEPEKLSDSEVREMLVGARGAYESGKYGEAISTLERVSAAEPQNAEALGYLGASYHQSGRNSDAIRVYERYLKLVPGDYRTRNFLEELKKK